MLLAAGAVTAAKFLQKFVGDIPWAHLDIAGTAWKVVRPRALQVGLWGCCCSFDEQGCARKARQSGQDRQGRSGSERCYASQTRDNYGPQG